MDEMHERRLKATEEARRKWVHDNSHVKEMLNTFQGKKFLEELRKETINPEIYVQGSFDKTAYNLGKLHVYLMLERIQKEDY